MVNKKLVAVTAAAALIFQVLAVMSIAPATAATSSGAPSGAVFTTDESGSRVNANNYDDKRDVYIDGGPGPNAPQTAAALDDGNYYFQVTGTDGRTLFSSDPVKCREFRVKDGLIVEYVSANRTYAVPGGARFCHLDGKDIGRHDTGTDRDHNATTIQLTPFNNTSNQGGVYKLWVTNVNEFQGNASLVDNGVGNGSYHGFVHSASKTDNFKVKVTTTFVAPTLTVRKFDDADGNGAWDSGEAEIGVAETVQGGGWPVAVVDAAAFASIGYTPYVYYTGFAGNYTAVESGHDGWVQTGLIVDGQAKAVNATAQVHVNYTSGETHTVTYGNFQCYLVTGSKVNDTNGNGVADSGEGTIAGWTIQLYRNGNLYATTTTGSDGKYSFGPLCQGGSFVVKEVNKDGWTQTGNKDYSFTAKSGVSRANLVFTNHKNDTKSAPSCLLLCLRLKPPTSVDLDASLLFNAAVGADVAAFVLDCTDIVAAVAATVTVDVDAAVDTDAGCGCNPNETDAELAIVVVAAADTTAAANASSNASSSSSPPPCTSACDTSPSTATDVSVDATATLAADVAADVLTPCGCATPDVGAVLVADASAAVSADVLLT